MENFEEIKQEMLTLAKNTISECDENIQLLQSQYKKINEEASPRLYGLPVETIRGIQEYYQQAMDTFVSVRDSFIEIKNKQEELKEEINKL